MNNGTYPQCAFGKFALSLLPSISLLLDIAGLYIICNTARLLKVGSR